MNILWIWVVNFLAKPCKSFLSLLKLFTIFFPDCWFWFLLLCWSGVHFLELCCSISLVGNRDRRHICGVELMAPFVPSPLYSRADGPVLQWRRRLHHRHLIDRLFQLHCWSHDAFPLRSDLLHLHWRGRSLHLHLAHHPLCRHPCPGGKSRESQQTRPSAMHGGSAEVKGQGQALVHQVIQHNSRLTPINMKIYFWGIDFNYPGGLPLAASILKTLTIQRTIKTFTLWYSFVIKWVAHWVKLGLRL